MLKRFSFEIKITGILLVILTLLALTGLFAYERFSEAVDKISKNEQPDKRFLEAKTLINEINEADISVKSYRITQDTFYLAQFDKSIENVDRQFNHLSTLSESLTENKNHLNLKLLDSLIDQKTKILKELIELQDGLVVQKVLSKVIKKAEKVSTVDSIITITIENSKIITEKPNAIADKPKKKTFLKSLFGRKQDKVIDTRIVVDTNAVIAKDSRVTMSALNEEISSIRLQELRQKKKYTAAELELIVQDQQVSKKIKALFDAFETAELDVISIANKATEGDIQRTHKLIAWFCIIASVLLLLMALIIMRFVRKNNRYKRELIESKKQAEYLAMAKQKFLANMSHEIRNPMNAIVGFSEQISQGSLTDAQSEQMEMVRKSTDHLLFLVDDILDLSKLQADKIVLEKISFNPKEIVSEVFKFLENRIRKTAIIGRLIMDENIPEVLIGDPHRFRQILFNLVSNAIKFTNTGEIKIVAKVIAMCSNNCCLYIEIEDSGIGMSDEQKKNVFNEFEQAEMSTSRNFGGTGLGLSIVKSLVDLHEGVILLKSKPNEGTTATLELSYGIGTLEDLCVQKLPIAINSKEISRLRVLIVDDEKYNCLLLMSILKKWGVTYKAVSNGKAAVDAVHMNTYDLVLMDVRMPVMDGLEASKVMRAMESSDKRDIPIIALTAFVSDDDKAKYVATGINGFVSKPFKEQELIHAIETSLQLKLTQTTLETTNFESFEGVDFKDLRKASAGNTSFYLDMLNTFVQGTELGITIIQENLVIKDWQSMADQAHKISPPCLHLNAKTLYDLLKEVERTIEYNINLEEVTALVQKTCFEANRIVLLIKSEIEKQENISQPN